KRERIHKIRPCCMKIQGDYKMAFIQKSPCDEGIIQCAPYTAPSVEARQRSVGTWVLVATILGSSMAFIDGTVVNVALPVLQTDLNATATDVQWVVEAYSLFLASLILVGGSLGDHFGRRRVFALGIFLFTRSEERRVGKECRYRCCRCVYN